MNNISTPRIRELISHQARLAADSRLSKDTRARAKEIRDLLDEVLTWRETAGEEAE